MPLAFHAAGYSDVGRVRTNNEDAAFASPRLLVLADGMGGAAGGEIASALTVHVLRRLDEPGEGGPSDRLLTALGTVRHLLREVTHEVPSLAGMGTTLIGLLTDGEHGALLHLGDSRAYRLREGHLRQLTTDHTFVQGLVDEGLITSQEARTHPYRAMVTRALDDHQTTPADRFDPDLQLGDRLLLCSDGLSDVVESGLIAEQLQRDQAEKAAFGLVHLALDLGSRDNVTVLVADVVDAVSVAEPLVLGSAAETLALPWTDAAQVPVSLRWAAGLDVDPQEMRARTRWRFGRRS